MDYALPPLFALFIWWFGTGVVMLLDGMPKSSFRFSLGISTLIAAGALVCIASSAHNTTTTGAYAAFTCAVLVWGWHELTFLTGWLTGPRKTECSAPLRSQQRFKQAVQVILWHELALVAVGLFVVALTWGAPNQVATLSFAVLWVMRLSAKLNLFFGVRNRGESFLPPHLLYLASYFAHRNSNKLMPLTLVLGTALTVFWLVGASNATDDAQRVGLLLLASLLALAVIEHVFMIVPLSMTALWNWAQRRPQQPPLPRATAVAPLKPSPPPTTPSTTTQATAT